MGSDEINLNLKLIYCFAIILLYFNTNSVFHCCGQWNED